MTIRTNVRQQVGRLILDRADRANAFDDAMIADMTAALDQLIADPGVSVIVLQAEGKFFSGGGDLDWMRRMAAADAADNLADARRLAALMARLDESPKPTVARIQGSAVAGAIGLIACCDVAVASEEAEFTVSEVRIGLIPAVIGPYLVRELGARQARRWILTGDKFKAADAKAAGLVHEVVPWSALDAAVDRVVLSLLRGAPQALSAAKALVAAVDRPVDAALVDWTAEQLAAIRSGPEAREGVAAYLEKRRPTWSR